MKKFSELRTDYVDNPELEAVLNGSGSAEDIIEGFAQKGYEVTDEDIMGYLQEKLPAILEECPELQKKIDEACESEDLNGGLKNPWMWFSTCASGGASIGGSITFGSAAFGSVAGPVGLLIGAAAGAGIGAIGAAVNDKCG